MELSYIISQVLIVIAMVLLGISYLSKDKKIIMIICIICSILYGTQYFLLGALTGVFMNAIAIIRDYWFYVNAKREQKNKIYVLVILTILSIVLGIASYNNIISIIPAIATILFTYSIWQDNTKIYRFLAIPISIMWISYNIYYNSIVGIIAESVVLIFEVIGILKNDVMKSKGKIFM